MNTLRRVLELAGVTRDDSRAYDIARLDIVKKQIRLPRPEQFDRIIEIHNRNGSGAALA